MFTMDTMEAPQPGTPGEDRLPDPRSAQREWADSGDRVGTR